MNIIKNWIELAEVPESETHRLEITPEDGNGWIREKAKPDDCGEYLSTHTFYGKTHEYSTKLLQSCGFDVVLANLDATQEEIDIMTSCDCGGVCPNCVEALKQITQK